MPLLTIFTAPKPMTNPHIAVIQRNAIQSWINLGRDVEVIIIGEEAGLSALANELHVKYLPDVQRNGSGTPLISSIFELGRKHGSGDLLAYINADILLLPNFVETARQIQSACTHFLAVGQRWDLDVREMLDFSPGWEERLRTRTAAEGKLHPPMGSDYFLYPRTCYEQVPAFAVGRAGWDNWMLFEARYRHWKLIDATDSIQIIHQNHDYSHLPNGEPHYRLPETAENIRLAGGKRTIFTLADCDQRWVKGRAAAPHASWKKFWREVEITPLVRWHSPALDRLSFTIFHPRKAWGEWKKQHRDLA